MKASRISALIVFAFLFTCCKKDSIPVVSTDPATEITTTSLVTGGSITDDGGARIISKGVCWKTSGAPGIEDDKTIDEGESDSFISRPNKLTPGTTYNIRAYATNSEGTGYGRIITITTLGDEPEIESPTVYGMRGDSVYIFVTVNPHSLSTAVQIELGETINYGSTYSLTESPVISNDEVQIITYLTGLPCDKKYHCRIKATNEFGIVYSEDSEFNVFCSLPTVTANYINNSDADTITVILSGDVHPGSLLTDVVFEWGKTTDYGNTVTAYESPISSHTSSPKVSTKISGLTPGTTYHYRIKATNKLGTVMSNDIPFRTLGSDPFVGNCFATDEQTRSVVLKAIISSNSLRTKVVFKWGLTSSFGNIQPAVESPLAPSFYSDTVKAVITGLAPGTSYYYQVKAVNALGTDSGQIGMFYTNGLKPSVRAKPVTDVKINSVTLTGTINPNFLPTTIKFEWGVRDWAGLTEYLNSITPSISPVTSSTDINVSVDLTGLDPETEYSFRIKAENELGTEYSYGDNFTPYMLKDADNNYYHGRTFGTQTWMTENLKTTRYENGDLIGTITGDLTSETNPKYQWAPEGGENNVSVYGRLYTWFAVTDSRKLCPAGWHVPSDSELATLIDFAGGKAIAGKLKEYGTSHWSAPNDGAQSGRDGFNALPAGSRTITGYLGGLNDLAYFWSSTEFDIEQAWYWQVMYVGTIFDNHKIDKKLGASVRCVKD